MEVDIGKLRALEVRLVYVEHTPWLVLRELQRGVPILVPGRYTERPANLCSRACRQTHSIQPLTSSDHGAPIVQAEGVQAESVQGRAPAWRCQRAVVAHWPHRSRRSRRRS